MDKGHDLLFDLKEYRLVNKHYLFYVNGQQCKQVMLNVFD